MDESELLPGSLECLTTLHEWGVPAALASASKNAGTVIQRLQIAPLFRFVVEAARIVNAKPAPEIFLAAAKGLNVEPARAVVFEDAPAGVEAAHAAGMFAVGVGSAEALREADRVVPDLAHVDLASLFGPGGSRRAPTCSCVRMPPG